MEATLKATDLLEGKSIEFGCNVQQGADYAQVLNTIARQKKGREQIIKGLKLYFGEARLELIYECEVLAEGKMSYNAFSGRGDVETKNMVKELCIDDII